MTAATAPTPGVGLEGATQEPSGGDAIPGAPAAAPEGTPGAGDASSQDYLGRIRADADFAVREVTGHQSRADRAEAEVRKLSEMVGGESEALSALRAQGLTPDMIAGAATNYFVLRANPQTQETVLGLERTGAIPDGASPNPSTIDDEYLTDEQREIRSLKAELQQVRQETAGLTQSTGSAAMQGHLERFAAENFLKPEEFEAVKKGMGGQVQQWGTNEPGLKLLRDLQNPTSYDTVETVAWKFIPREVRFQLGERKRLHDQQKVAPYRTDVPTDAATTGRELPAEVRGAQAALEYAKANPDKI